MRFGQVHCGTHSESFVLFLEFGLLPLLQRGPFDFGDTASAGDASTLAGSRVCQRQLVWLGVGSTQCS